MLSSLIILCLSSLAYSATVPIPKKCPTFKQLQSPRLAESFSLDKFAQNDRFYEIAYKDLTQPRFCKCITSEKRINGSEILDNFTIQCAGQPYSSDLHFEITDSPGVFQGTWNQGGISLPWVFPDTVVDVGVNKKTGQYDWVVEFQCLDGARGVSFYAFNFYSRVNTDEFYQDMLDVAMAKFPEFVMNGNQIKKVDHTDCWYDQE
ncbi:MAG: hypothetical protein SGCHY_003554 [Lobulomycetales sp.]